MPFADRINLEIFVETIRGILVAEHFRQRTLRSAAVNAGPGVAPRERREDLQIWTFIPTNG